MLICKYCFSEDCNCVCTICNKQQPKINTPVKKTRRKKGSQEDWISCNLCRKWVPPICTGLTKKENIKISKLIKEKKVDYFFQCLSVQYTNTQIDDKNNTLLEKGDQTESNKEIIRDTKKQP